MPYEDPHYQSGFLSSSAESDPSETVVDKFFSGKKPKKQKKNYEKNLLVNINNATVKAISGA